jgi:hypothetical protein
MGETNYTIAGDLNEARKMADGLEDYIQTEPIYGTVGGGFFSGGRMPALTTGALLMRVQRLRAREEALTPEQRAELGKIEDEIARVRKEWRLHFDQKVEREARSRLKSLSQFFEDLREDPRAAANAWLPEALRRTIIYALDQAMQNYGIDRGDLPQRIASTDAALRRHTEKAPFVWARELEAVYPADTFWWLYARPPKPKK